MSGLENWSWAYDGWIVLAGMLCAVAASLPGNFLLLRRMSLLGDAISHAILPGLAVAFFVSESRSSWPMFLGAVIVGILTALFTEWIRNFGDVDEGASMGVVFTTLFAIGLVLIVQAADHVDLDPGCVLYGAIEMTPLDTLNVAGQPIPRVVIVLGAVTLVNLLFVVLFFKELKLSAFDPALATSVGFSARLMHYLLMVIVAVTAVASFETAGNILVVAMFVVPPATAFLLTERLGVMIFCSAIIAMLSAGLGHLSAVFLPHAFGFQSTSTSGMMALCAGMLFFVASLVSPRNGVIVRIVRRQKLALRILSEDLIALLYRMDERARDSAVSPQKLSAVLRSHTWLAAWLMNRHVRTGHVIPSESGYRLTEAGRQLGSVLVRSHRLWEQYLVSEGGVAVDRIHGQAEKLEHFTNRELRDRLDEITAAPATDPHGSRIPSEHK
ncbi:MAG: iron ABC transporter [Planctomycetota bacterium]|nr:metal ABC transporter permease [Planctomycetales bacterium]RLT07860.1 MAG: iron ABC transporter [Planctomycetota bacterium]